jgi:hypothetical protein
MAFPELSLLRQQLWVASIITVLLLLALIWVVQRPK